MCSYFVFRVSCFVFRARIVIVIELDPSAPASTYFRLHSYFVLRNLSFYLYLSTMNQQNSPLWRQIISLALPLILSMTGLVLMQFVDALLLSWYSPEAIAAIAPAGMASYLLISLFLGASGFTSTLVAHYVGAGKPHRAFSAAWQGIYFSLLAGTVVFALGFTAKPLFSWVNHAEQVRIFEQSYFAITCWGAVAAIAAGAISGYFTGQGKTRIVMIVQLAGFALNAILDYRKHPVKHVH